MEDIKIRLAITHGDFNGISYEVILKTFSEPYLLNICTPILYGSIKIASYFKNLCNIEKLNFNVIKDASEAKSRQLNIINCIPDNETLVEFGKSTEMAGRGALKALERAMKDIEERKVQALLTAPINKKNIQSKDFHFPGHTEFLQASEAAKGQKSLMILCSEELRVALVTGHIPIAEVASQITEQTILNKLFLFNQSLRYDFSINSPRIAVLGLNPHAGDGGLIGDEEETIIKPAIQKAIDKGLLVFGPFSADGFFGSGKQKEFEGVLAMYHDQGLAPFKVLSMDNGVNYTAGLPFVRTSPAHGTAYDIAGQNIASEKSFREAVYMAIETVKNRREYSDLRRNQLRKQYFDKGNGKDLTIDMSEGESENNN